MNYKEHHLLESRYFMLRLYLNYLGSEGSQVFLRTSVALCLISFFSSLIFISFSFSYFSFSFRISSFLYYYCLFWCSSWSIIAIFSCQCFYTSFFSLSRFSIYCSSSSIIQGDMTGCTFLLFYFYLFWASFCSIYLILFCLVMYCSWFLLSILQFSTSFSLSYLDSSLTLASWALSYAIFVQYQVQFFIDFRALFCSLLIFRSADFSSSSAFNSFFRALRLSSFEMMVLLSQTFSSCLFTKAILFLSSWIYNCCFLSSSFLAFRLSSSYSVISLLFFTLSLDRISSICLVSSYIWVLSLMLCYMSFYRYEEVPPTMLCSLIAELGSFLVPSFSSGRKSSSYSSYSLFLLKGFDFLCAELGDSQKSS